MTVKKSKLAVKKAAKATESSISKKGLLTIIGIVLVLATIGTVALIWTQADFTVARINRIPIRHSEVEREIWRSMQVVAEEQGLWHGTDEFDRAVREDAARQIAIEKLFRDYADQLGLAFPAGTSLEDISTNVIWTILADPDLFARYESYMELPDMPEPRDFEAIANDVLARARAGEDFDELMWTYSQDPGLLSFPDGYTFAPGQMIPAFEEATLNLEYGEISDLVWAVHGGLEGFHIIKRIPPNPDEVIEGVEMLGAKHILIQEDPPFDIDQFRRQAVVDGLFARIDTELQFRSALNRVPVQ